MKEILFRGKKTDTGEWVEGFFIKRADDCLCYAGENYIVNCDKDGFNWHVVDPATVGQYTGLTDNNGKKIFKGDIVEGADFTAEDGGYGVVFFDEGAFEVCGNNIIGTFHENYWGKEFEVIGNIHDNPEPL